MQNSPIASRGICEDEFFPEADETEEELKQEYNKHREHVKTVHPPGEPSRRDAVPADYVDHKLPPEIAATVQWETRETPAVEGEEIWTENELFQEAYGFRPNGCRSHGPDGPRDVHGHGIYSKDLNWEALDNLTAKFRGELNLILYVENQYSDYRFPTWSGALEQPYTIN